MTETDPPTVLIVEDEVEVASLYHRWLAAEYDVRVAHDGDSAIAQYDAEVDVVLLDRQMPGRSGDEVLAEIRSRTQDVRVALVTAIDPDFDVVDMGFDDYVVKPVDEKALYRVVERLLNVAEYDADLQEYFALVSKQAVLEAEKTEEERASNEKFAALQSRIRTLREQLDQLLLDLDPADYEVLFRDFARSSSSSDSSSEAIT